MRNFILNLIFQNLDTKINFLRIFSYKIICNFYTHTHYDKINTFIVQNPKN